MTRFFVTTGTSVNTCRCWQGMEGLWQARSLDQLVESRGVEALKQVREAGQERRARLVGLGDTALAEEAVQIAAGELATECWQQRDLTPALPAELATIRVMIRSTEMARGDRISLIAGVSNLAETWLLWGMLQYLQASGDTLIAGIGIDKPLGPYQVDPTETAEMRAGVAALWQDANAGDTAHHLVLTAGYKGMLIELTRLVSQQFDDYSVYYLYEEQNDVIVITPYEIRRARDVQSRY
jgi:hypothetical protein